MTVSQRAITMEGRKAKCWIGGSGQPLVLVQGGLGDARQHWAPSFDALSEHFQIIAPDLPGFGVSDPLPMPNYQNYLSWLQLLFDMLNIGGPVGMMGHSFGAVLSRLFAAENTGYVSRLVLVDGGAIADTPGFIRPVFRLPGVGRTIFNLSHKQPYSYSGLKQVLYDEKMITPAFIANAQAAALGSETAMRQIATTTPPTLRTPTCSTLVLWGEHAQLSPVADGRKVAAEINGAHFTVIKKAAHMPQIEQPVDFHAEVLPFLSGK